MGNKTHYVLGLAFNEDKTKIVLMKKARPSWQAGKLNGVGGKIEVGEIPLAAMVREFQEETGVVTAPGWWKESGVLQGDIFKIHVFCCFNDSVMDSKTATDEEVVVSDISLDALARKGVSNLAWITAMLMDPDQKRFEFEVGYDLYSRFPKLPIKLDCGNDPQVRDWLSENGVHWIGDEDIHLHSERRFLFIYENKEAGYVDNQESFERGNTRYAEPILVAFNPYEVYPSFFEKVE